MAIATHWKDEGPKVIYPDELGDWYDKEPEPKILDYKLVYDDYSEESEP